MTDRYFALVIHDTGAQLGTFQGASTNLGNHLAVREAALKDAASHLRLALAQALPSDDAIIMQHVQDALNLIGADLLAPAILPPGCRITRSIEITKDLATRGW